MARTIKDEVLRWNLVINGDSARKELHELNQSQREILATQKELEKEAKQLERAKKTESDRYREVQAELKSLNSTYATNKTRINQLQAEIGLTGKTMSELRRESKMLSAQLAHMVPGTQQYRELEDKLKAINSRMDELRGKSKQVEFSIGRLADGMNRYASMGATVIATITGVILTMQKFIESNKELADQEANVMKTTGLTREAVAELRMEFNKWNTKTPRLELLKLAEEAGRLGKKSKHDILEFVKTANMLQVALGDDLGDSAAIREVGKITEQFRISEKYTVSAARAMEMYGSAINEVSASGSNAAPFLVDFSKRIAGIDQLVNLGAANVLGYAASLDEAGQQAETSSTVFNRLLPNMFKDPATFAKIARMEVGEFTKLLKTDANAAFLKFLEGMKGQNEGFDVMAKKMDNLGLDGARAIAVLSSLANNIDKIKERQTLANRALEEGSSLMNEYSIKNNNFAANWQKISRAVGQAFLNSSFIKGMRDLADIAAKYIEIPLSRTLEEERISLRVLEMQLLQTNLKGEDRVKLINQLKEQYPGYLQNIDAEKSSMEDVSKAISRVNDELINKIILQKNDEKIQTQNERIAKQRLRFIEMENDLMREAVKLAKAQGLAMPVGVDALDQAIKLYSKLEGNELFRGRWFDDRAKFAVQINNLQSARAKLNGLEANGNAMLEEREKLIVRLGIKMQEVSAKEIGATGDTADAKLSVDEIRSIRDDSHKQLLLDIDAFIKNEEALHAEAYVNGLLGEKEYQEGLHMLQYTAFRMRREALAGYLNQLGSDEGEKRKTTEGQIADIRKQAAEWEMKDMENFGQWSEDFMKDHFEKAGQLADDAYEKLKAKNALSRREALTRAEIGVLKSTPGSKDELEARKNLRNTQMQLELENTQLTELEKEKIVREFDARRRQLDKDYRRNWGELALQSVNTISSSIIAIGNHRLQKELDGERQASDRKKDALKRQLDSSLISEETYRTQLAKLEDDYRSKEREIKTEQFKRQRAADAIQAGINTALSVTRLLYNPILATIAGIAGAAQVATILSQPVPAFNRGKYPVTTTEGKRYNASYSGAVKTGVYSKPTLGLFGEEGKEIVISGPHVKNLEMNYPEIIEAIMYTRTPAFAAGKYNVQASSAAAPVQREIVREAMPTQLLMEMYGVLKSLQDEGVHAKMAWRQYQDFKETAEKLEKDYRV